jgi:hypothetical protein
MQSEATNKQSRVVFTPEAEAALADLKERIVKDLVEFYVERKYYPDSEVVEITANDIRLFYRYIEINKERETSLHYRRLSVTNLISRAYTILGLLLMLGSIPFIFYPELSTNLARSIRENSAPFATFVAGLCLFIASYAFLWMRRLRK